MAEEEQVKAEYTAATRIAGKEPRTAGKEPRTAGKEPRRTIGKGMDDDDDEDEDEDDKESDTEDRKRNVKSGQGRGKDMGNHSDEDEEKEKKGMCIKRFFFKSLKLMIPLGLTGDRVLNYWGIFRNLICVLGSVAGHVIQANGRLTFEDDLRSGGLLYFTTQ